METALHGKFNDFVRVSAQEAEVKEAKCDQGQFYKTFLANALVLLSIESLFVTVLT